MIDPDVNSYRVELRGLEPHRGSLGGLLGGQFYPAAPRPHVDPTLQIVGQLR
jgi:hypothetical protein